MKVLLLVEKALAQYLEMTWNKSQGGGLAPMQEMKGNFSIQGHFTQNSVTFP